MYNVYITAHYLFWIKNKCQTIQTKQILKDKNTFFIQQNQWWIRWVFYTVKYCDREKKKNRDSDFYILKKNSGIFMAREGGSIKYII